MDEAFSLSAALAVLEQGLEARDVPLPLLRDRLAFDAAEACLAHGGRPRPLSDLRDEVHFLRPGEQAGPARAVVGLWRKAAGRPLGVQTEGSAAAGARVSLPVTDPGAGPVEVAATVLEAALTAAPREIAAALVAADVSLARAFGWSHLVPVLGIGLQRRDLTASGDEMRRACHRAVLRGATMALRTASDLARRAARLRAVAPKLRARGAGAAVELFLARDALAPGIALVGPGGMQDRAARRFCDRLVALGVVRELSGRTTSRLYGV
ncbi:uncharacterized protein DUF1403 [Palleronia aestuarii]|uniref:Uncharacterized protein DUF1403 n=2 Tax=Palleronia aestuarii TaxID=568105 RepID=A0A2W7MYV6_9RHOB|nr:uncharacterized protein DUF1403 [Palleronia aestuarii]